MPAVRPAPERLVHARDLLEFIDASPTPWHAVATTEAILHRHGFARLDEAERWQLAVGSRYYVVRGGSSIAAFVLGSGRPEDTGLRLVGAHTDSPGLRLKPKPALGGDGLLRLAVEVYGGPILATFADRDLGLAGRIFVRAAVGAEARLVRIDEPLLRLPNLPIHMNREVNDQGLKFNRQTELPLILTTLSDEKEAEAWLRSRLADLAAADEADILSWELAAYDVHKGSFWGAEGEFIASGRLDNLASCHAAIRALVATGDTAATAIVTLFDHEEVGSGSAAGAGGTFAADIVDRLCHHSRLDAEDRRRTLARSFLISADMAHAYQPSFPGAYEPGHKVMVNQGPVIKTHASQRYATNAETAARFMGLCAAAGVPCQQYAHRGDLSCGSTIGPIVAASLGIASVDVGSAMWAMHSARESAGAYDQAYMISALGAAFAS